MRPALDCAAAIRPIVSRFRSTRVGRMLALLAIPLLLASCGGEPAVPPAADPDPPVAAKEAEGPPVAPDPRPTIESATPPTSTATRGAEGGEPRRVAQPLYRASDPPPVHDDQGDFAVYGSTKVGGLVGEHLLRAVHQLFAAEQLPEKEPTPEEVMEFLEKNVRAG